MRLQLRLSRHYTSLFRACIFWNFLINFRFMIAAVSPAVVIPSVILLQDAGWGVAKGVPSLVMAASGIDDVLAIGESF